jgi:hypothetical protein
MSGLTQDDGLLQDIRGLIEEARSAVAVTVNATADAVLADRAADSGRSSSGRSTGRLWERDSCHTVATIDKRVWERVYLLSTNSYGEVF